MTGMARLASKAIDRFIADPQGFRPGEEEAVQDEEENFIDNDSWDWNTY